MFINLQFVIIWTIGIDIAILLGSFVKKSIDGAVPIFLGELACGGLKGGLLEQK